MFQRRVVSLSNGYKKHTPKTVHARLRITDSLCSKVTSGFIMHCDLQHNGSVSTKWVYRVQVSVETKQELTPSIHHPLFCNFAYTACTKHMCKVHKLSKQLSKPISAQNLQCAKLTVCWRVVPLLQHWYSICKCHTDGHEFQLYFTVPLGQQLACIVTPLPAKTEDT